MPSRTIAWFRLPAFGAWRNSTTWAPWRTGAALALTLVLIKTLWLLIDTQPRFFLGDSNSYIWAGLEQRGLPDRSSSYPLLLHYLAPAGHDFTGLILAQTLAGVGTALLLWWSLQLALGVRQRWAVGASLLLAVLPEQLYYEHALLTETFSLFFFALATASGLHALNTRKLSAVVVFVLAGLAAISFRVSFVPVILGLTGLLTLGFGNQLRTGSLRWRALIAGVCLIGLTGVSHAWFKGAIADLAMQEGIQTRADYIINAEEFLVATVAPLLQPRHLAELPIPADFLGPLEPALRDQRAREYQRWGPDGMVERLKAVVPAPEREIVMKKIALRALRENRMGFVRMQMQLYSDYFDPTFGSNRLSTDLGDRDDKAFSTYIQRNFGVNVHAATPAADGPVARYMRHSRWYFCALLIAMPLLALALGLRAAKRVEPVHLIVALLALGLALSHFIFNATVNYRYLHAWPFLTLLVLGAMVGKASADSKLKP
jgi:hypothetical protein